MDLSLVRDLNNLFAHADGLEDVLVFYAQASEALFLVLLLVAFALVGAARRAVVSAGLSAALALALGAVISHLANRPRPFVSHPHAVHLFTAHAADPGFPSDHATASFAIAVAILLRHRHAGIIALAAATLLSLTRVAMGIHYPTDVLAGATLGTTAALALATPRATTAINHLADTIGSLPILRRTATPA
jgi:undecaprenyl-diphosphatase